MTPVAMISLGKLQRAEGQVCATGVSQGWSEAGWLRLDHSRCYSRTIKH